jgi:hypothetical protein
MYFAGGRENSTIKLVISGVVNYHPLELPGGPWVDRQAVGGDTSPHTRHHKAVISLHVCTYYRTSNQLGRVDACPRASLYLHVAY